MDDIKIGDVVTPNDDPHFTMTVISIEGDNVQCDFPDSKGGRDRRDFPRQALSHHVERTYPDRIKPQRLI